MATGDPVTISIVGTGQPEGGGVAPTPSGTLVYTPADQPNLLINAVPPLVAIGVRFVTLFLTTFLASLPVTGFVGTDMGTLEASALIAVSTAALGLLKDAITVFKRLEGKYPLLTGSI